MPLRMVATYRGPCTEYVLPSQSIETLTFRQDDSPHAISLTHFDVALFKGRLFDDEKRHTGLLEGCEEPSDSEQEESDGRYFTEDHAEGESYSVNSEGDLLGCPGIVHRSPRIQGKGVVRLILVLDIPADFHDADLESSDEE